MPPPVEDLSEDDVGDIPFSNAPELPDSTDQADIEEDDDVEEEGVFVVDKIVNHEFIDSGSLLLLVKWKGYEKPEDQTWEPEEGLKEGAMDVLTEYYKTIGGRPQQPAKVAAKGGPRKRKLMADSKAASPAAAAQPKKPRKSHAKEEEEAKPGLEEKIVEDSPNWVPKGKWENNVGRENVASVDTIIRDEKHGGLVAMLFWSNGKRTRASIEICYEKCPQTMLKFYEQHLVFKDS